MPQLQHILIAVLALYCCFMVFKVSASAGFFLLPLLFVLPPLVFKSRKKESGEEECGDLGRNSFMLFHHKKPPKHLNSNILLNLTEIINLKDSAAQVGHFRKFTTFIL